MDVEIINAFVGSTVETFQSMVAQDPRRMEPRLKQEQDKIFDVSASISVTGPYIGIVAINFHKDVACKSASAMLGEDHVDVDELVLDAVGEIVNIIAGGAKSSGLDYKISLPNVCAGSDVSRQFPASVPSIVIPFESGIGDFAIEVCMKKNEEDN